MEIDTNQIVKEKVENGERTIIAEWERKKRREQTQQMQAARQQQIVEHNKLEESTHSVTNEKPKEEKPKTISESKPSSVAAGSKKATVKEALENDRNDSVDNFFVNLPSEQSVNESNVGVLKQMRGWLSKESPGTITRYQKRYFISEETVISYYQTEAADKKKGLIEFNNLTRVDVDKKDQKKFTLITKDREYKLKAETDAEAKEWVEFFKYQIDMKDIRNI